MSLPPMPDNETGQPRPPRAPLALEWKYPTTTEEDPSVVPAPPEGHGPALEWYYKRGVPIWYTSVLIIALLAVVYTVVTLSFSWTSTWWLWLLFFLGPIYGLALRRGCWCVAGANWYQHGDEYVNTYELTSVAIIQAARDTLELKDRDGNEITPHLDDAQRNQALWDLVYNGILHSVHRGGATTNERARLLLQLGQTRHDVAE